MRQSAANLNRDGGVSGKSSTEVLPKRTPRASLERDAALIEVAFPMEPWWITRTRGCGSGSHCSGVNEPALGLFRERLGKVFTIRL